MFIIKRYERGDWRIIDKIPQRDIALMQAWMQRWIAYARRDVLMIVCEPGISEEKISESDLTIDPTGRKNKAKAVHVDPLFGPDIQ